MRFPYLLFLTAAVGFADDSPVPVPVTADDYAALLERPPFRRMLSLSESLVLSGVASLPGGKVVTVWNRRTDESFVVSGTPNAQGWKLVSLDGGSDLRSVAATIAAGPQEVVVRFDPERLIPRNLDNDSRPGARSETAVVVEALLRSLDPGAARNFESLPAEPQEEFRKSFARYLDTYPDASDGQRIDFVRRTLSEVSGSAAPDALQPADPAAAAPGPAPSVPEPLPDAPDDAAAADAPEP